MPVFVITKPGKSLKSKPLNHTQIMKNQFELLGRKRKKRIIQHIQNVKTETELDLLFEQYKLDIIYQNDLAQLYYTKKRKLKNKSLWKTHKLN